MSDPQRTLDAALDAIGRGYQVFPIRPASKRPNIPNWTTITWEEGTTKEQFEARVAEWGFVPGEPYNLGVVLGPSSNNLVDIDIDYHKAKRLRDLLPRTQARSGRTGSPDSHYWYQVEGDHIPSTRRYKMPDQSTVSIEFRYDRGVQTVIPPSDWVPKDWDADGQAEHLRESRTWARLPWGGKSGPAVINGRKLATQVALIALGTVLIDNWPTSGTRHEAYLALAGGLLRMGDGVIHPFWERNAAVLVRALAEATNDDDGPDVREAESIDSTIRGLRDGKMIWGFPKLAEFLGDDYVSTVRSLVAEVESLAGFASRQATSIAPASGPTPASPALAAAPTTTTPSSGDPTADGEPVTPETSVVAPATTVAVDENAGTWGPVDLLPYLTGQFTTVSPTVLKRDDGRALFYPGRLNMLFAPSESGKAQPYSSIVQTPTGPRRMGDLVVGDQVLGLNGKAQTVEGVYERGEMEVWEVVVGSGHGITIECAGDHLWSVRRSDTGYQVLDTKTLFEKGVLKKAGAPAWHLPHPLPAKFEASAESTPLAPYTLGALIGDGGVTHGLALHARDQQIIDRVLSENPLITGHPIPRGGVTLTTPRGRANPVLNGLRELGLHGFRSYEKRIPERYLRASVDDRLALLHGLMDTDGTVEGRAAKLTTTSPRLAEQVMELVRSLGGIAHVSWRIPTLNGVEHRPSADVTVRLPLGMETFFLDRKRERYLGRVTRNNPTQSIRSITATGRLEPMRCLRVSNEDHLYLTNGYVATHNTLVALHTSLEQIGEGERVMFIDFEDEPVNTIERLKSMGAGDDDLMMQFMYIRPDGPIATMQRDHWGSHKASPLGSTNAVLFAKTLEDFDPTLIIADGMTSIYGLHGLDSNNSVETDVITSWLKSLSRNGRTTVVIIDHMAKTPTRGSMPIGSQHKVAMVQGTLLQVWPVTKPVLGSVGKLELIVLKDRPGQVRRYAGKLSGNAQVAALVTIDSTTNGGNTTTVVVASPPPATPNPTGSAASGASVSVTVSASQAKKSKDKQAKQDRMAKLDGIVLGAWKGDADLKLSKSEARAIIDPKSKLGDTEYSLSFDRLLASAMLYKSEGVTANAKYSLDGAGLPD